jgi:hypothetical protein
MRLLTGIVASCSFETLLEGDESLSSRPMERVAEPLRAMGAEVRTSNGLPPVVVRGGSLTGIEHRMAVPSAQVKSAVLLAGLAAFRRAITPSEPWRTWERPSTPNPDARAFGPSSTKGSTGPFPATSPRRPSWWRPGSSPASRSGSWTSG